MDYIKLLKNIKDQPRELCLEIIKKEKYFLKFVNEEHKDYCRQYLVEKKRRYNLYQIIRNKRRR